MPDSSLTQLRHRLLCRIGRRYRVVTEEIKFGGLCFSFTRIADPDRVLDEVAAEADLRDRLAGSPAPGDELHLPYWAELWESARGVGEFLVSAESRVQSAELRKISRVVSSAAPSLLHSALCTLHSALIPPALHSALWTYSVLDLGCGMGMAGTVAAALGAKVLFADLEPPALLFAQLNSSPWRDRVRTRRLDWQRDCLHERFDVILGADILYERVQWDFLEPFWRAHLTDGGQVLLGEPGRQTGDMFIEWITARGWQLNTIEIPLTTRPRPIRILTLSIY